MHPAEVVIGEVQCHRRFEVLLFLAECQGEASHAAHEQPGAGIQPLDIASRNPVAVWSSLLYVFGSGNHATAAVTPFPKRIRAVYLDDLPIVHVLAKRSANGIRVGCKAIGRYLYPVGHA